MKNKILLSIGMISVAAAPIASVALHPGDDHKQNATDNYQNVILDSSFNNVSTAYMQAALSQNMNISPVSSSAVNKTNSFRKDVNFEVKYKNEKSVYNLLLGLKSNNISNGYKAKIFEDSHGNLFSMGIGSGLQKSTDGITWEKAGDTTINDGQGGTIFEDSRGHLYAMSKGTKLQRSTNQGVTWNDVSGLNISDGEGGKIFEDFRGELLVMANGSKLWRSSNQVTTWSDSTGTNLDFSDGEGGQIFEDTVGSLYALGKGTRLQASSVGGVWWRYDANSNITNGYLGKIFEDSRGNIFAMGKGTSLQKKLLGIYNWEDNPTSNIADGFGGTIFEDSHGNLFSMGNGTPLQKSINNGNSWIDVNNSNITDGHGGQIFEDSRGTLFSMGNGTGLQKSTDSGDNWTPVLGSNITDGNGGQIFEDSRGNIFAIGNNSKLQVSIDRGNTWIYDGMPSATDSSTWKKAGNTNINDGEGGIIFEDSRGSLFATGKGKRLKKSIDQGETWNDVQNSNISDGDGAQIFENSNGFLFSIGKNASLQRSINQGDTWSDMSNSNIESGEYGQIFEDSRGHLFVMGRGKNGKSGLQRSKNQGINWDTPTGLSFKNGKFGQIFEDSRGTLFAMGIGHKLQKSINEGDSWTDVSSSKITDGYGGQIFEDSRGTLFAMGNGTPLQKSTNHGQDWTDVTGSNITDGYGARIFEDSRGNLFAMSQSTEIRKWDVNTMAWKDVAGSNITDGVDGQFFEDSFGNLFSMGNTTGLQKSIDNGDTWTPVTGSNISSGYKGQIFEDSHGSLFVMSEGNYLQKLESTIDLQNSPYPNIVYDSSVLYTANESNINITSYINHLRGAELQYSIDGGTPKKVIGNNIKISSNDEEISFSWKLDNEYELIAGDSLPEEFSIILYKPNIGPITKIDPTYSVQTGTFTVPTYTGDGAILQYQISGSTTWENLSKTNSSPISVDAGKTVSFKWELEDPTKSVWKNGIRPTPPSDIDFEILVDTPIIGNIARVQPTYANQTGTFTVPTYTGDGAILQYQISGTTTWENVSKNNSAPISVDAGKTVSFKWELENSSNSKWKNGSVPTGPSDIIFKILVDAPTIGNIARVQPTYANQKGTFTVPTYTADGAVLQYRISGTPTWENLPKTNSIPILVDQGKTVSFQWELEHPSKSGWKGGIIPTNPSDIIFITSSIIGVKSPSNPIIVKVQPTFNSQKGSFTVPTYTADDAILQYQISGSTTWENVSKTNSAPISVDAGKTVSFQWELENPSNSGWEDGMIPIAPDDITFKIPVDTPATVNVSSIQPSEFGQRGSFTVPTYIADGAILQYQISSSGTWTELPKTTSTKLDVDQGKTVSFRWVLENTSNSIWEDGQEPKAPLDITFDNIAKTPAFDKKKRNNIIIIITSSITAGITLIGTSIIGFKKFKK